ncbi:hypothetical protein CTAYLR_007515 [Chrysophaeum taylorii]|uniref:Potassium channel domain-containing protein n=1 Tax=Chrysophaeum taylorii TaxID=2483200 RepID=A0AAD7XIA7_9STRA|nr:hypothetical protein CTAYLR_007515 [Chrysophaeum taylorii]
MVNKVAEMMEFLKHLDHQEPVYLKGDNVQEPPLEILTLWLTYGAYATIMKPLCIFARACHAASSLQMTVTAHNYAQLVVTAYGGGILVPLLLGSRPAPLVVDGILIAALTALLLFTTPFRHLYALAPIKVFGLLLEAMFRVNLISGMIGAASKALPSSAGPVVCGCIAGVGGLFLPFTKGLDALKPPIKSSIVRVVVTATFIAVSTRPERYWLDGVKPWRASAATALCVAANGLYDVLAYLLPSQLLFPPKRANPPKPQVIINVNGALQSEILFLSSALSVVLGALAFQYTEGAGPLDAAFRSATTLATVGMGDAPDTLGGRFVSALLMIFGVSLFATNAHQAYASARAYLPGAPLFILGGGAILIGALEDWDFPSAAYFVVNFASTVGHVDLAPKSPEGKAATIAFSFVAAPALADLVAAITLNFLATPPRLLKRD